MWCNKAVKSFLEWLRSYNLQVRVSLQQNVLLACHGLALRVSLLAGQASEVRGALQVKGTSAQNLDKSVGFYGLDVYSLSASTQVHPHLGLVCIVIAQGCPRLTLLTCSLQVILLCTDRKAQHYTTLRKNEVVLLPKP